MREGSASLAEGWGSTAAARAASPRDAASTVRPSRGAAKVELSGKPSGDATPARTSPFGTEGADGSLQCDGHPPCLSVHGASALRAHREPCRGPLRVDAGRGPGDPGRIDGTRRARLGLGCLHASAGRQTLPPPRLPIPRVGELVREDADETTPPVLRERCAAREGCGWSHPSGREQRSALQDTEAQESNGPAPTGNGRAGNGLPSGRRPRGRATQQGGERRGGREVR